MKSLEDFQDVVARILVALAVVHVCALTGLAALFGRSVVVTFGATALLAAVPVIWQLSGRPGRSTAFALVPALVGQTAILVWLFSEHPWQVEMHFYFFAVLAMLAGFCHVGVLAAAAATIAVHHLILNFVMPSLLYPGGTDVGRVVVHAGFVLVEAGMLALIGNAIRSAFRQAAESELQKSRAVDDLRSAQGALKSALAASGEDVGRLSSRLVDLQTRIGERLDGLLAASETLAGNATKLSGASITVSEKAATTISSASDTSIKVEEVAAVGQNFIRIFAEIATQSAGSTALSEGAVAKVQLTKTTIGQLAVMSTDIDRASKAIETIARQTNLLALNATIEAARAGASGRGFVVVASEVKALAASTAETAADIGKRIVAMQSVVRETVQSIGAIALGIGELDAASMKVSESVAAQEEAVGRIAAVSEAVSRNAERVADAVGAIDLLAQGARTSAGIVETAASDIAVQTAAIRAELTAFATDMAA